MKGEAVLLTPALSVETFFFWPIDTSMTSKCAQQVAVILFGSPDPVDYCDANHARFLLGFK